MSKTVFITGANRGLGLEFAKQFLKKGWNVIATCRNPDAADQLQGLSPTNDSFSIYPLDVTNISDIQHCKDAIGDVKIDVLINNAGISGQSGVTFGEIDVENLLKVIHTNAIAPLKLLEALHDNIKQSEEKCVVNISSAMGSIADNTSGKSYAYRTSKTALNMLMRSAAVDLADENIQILQVHPGWVQTDMGGEQALITIEESVSGMCHLIDNHKDYQSGEFYDYSGKQRSW